MVGCGGRGDSRTRRAPRGAGAGGGGGPGLRYGRLRVPGRLSNTARLAWVCAAALAVFVTWVATDESANLGIAFFYAVPVGLAAWWGGARWATVAVAGCVALYCIGAALQPVPSFGLTLALRLVVFAGVAVVVSLLRARLDALEDSARELSDLQKALTPPKLLELPDVDVAAAFGPSRHGGSGAS